MREACREPVAATMRRLPDRSERVDRVLACSREALHLQLGMPRAPRVAAAGRYPEVRAVRGGSGMSGGLRAILRYEPLDGALNADVFMELADDFTRHDQNGIAPLDRCSSREWLRRFRQVGYFHHHTHWHNEDVLGDLQLHESGYPFAPRRSLWLTFEEPADHTVLYRMAMPGLERRMSWTDDPVFALSFGPGRLAYHSFFPRIWRMTTPRIAVVARLTANRQVGGTDTEFVVDTHGLQMSPISEKELSTLCLAAEARSK
jgi:hypothetical protein